MMSPEESLALQYVHEKVYNLTTHHDLSGCVTTAHSVFSCCIRSSFDLISKHAMSSTEYTMITIAGVMTHTTMSIISIILLE